MNHEARRDRFRPEIKRRNRSPRRRMGHVVNHPRAARRRDRTGRLKSAWMRSRIVLREEVARLRDHRLRVQKIALDPCIKELWLRPLMRLTRGDLLRRDNRADMALRVVKIARDNSARRANHHARGLEVQLHAMRAKVALGGRVGLRIDIERVIRTGLHARLAPDTAAVVEIDDSIIAIVQGLGRANLDTRCVVAMITAHHAEVAARGGELALLDIFDPSAKNADRHAVLFLARDRTGMTSDTAIVVDYETVAHHSSSTCVVKLSTLPEERELTKPA